MDPDIVPTLPRPPALPRKSDLERLRASDEPGPAWLERIDELEATMLRLAESEVRTSKTDLAHDAQLAEHATRLARIEANTASTAVTTTTTAEGTAVLLQALTGRIPPKLLALAVVVATAVQLALQAYRQLHGGAP